MLELVLHPWGCKHFRYSPIPVSLLEIGPEGTKVPLPLAATFPLKKLISLEAPGSQLGTIGPGLAGKSSLGEGPALGPVSPTHGQQKALT